MATFVATTGLLMVPVAQAEEPVTISGTVWQDANANGLHDPDEPGMTGVGMGVVKPDGSLANSGYTGPDGGYRFDGMPPDTYHVAMLVPEGQTLVHPNAGDDARDSDLDRTDATSEALQCSGGDCGVLDAGLVEKVMDVALSTDPSEIQSPPGTRADVRAVVRNTGNVPLSDPTVSMPVTEAGPVENGFGPDWSCFVKRDTFLCSFSGLLKPNAATAELTIPLTVPEQPDVVELTAPADGDVDPADNEANIEVIPGGRQ